MSHRFCARDMKMARKFETLPMTVLPGGETAARFAHRYMGICYSSELLARSSDTEIPDASGNITPLPTAASYPNPLPTSIGK